MQFYKHCHTIILVIALSLPGIAICDDKKSMEPIQFTQCFKSFDEATDHLKERLYKDEARACYGQRWAMPHAYFNRIYMSSYPITETFVVRVGHPGLTPGNLIPQEKFVRLNNEVSVDPLDASGFEGYINHIKKSVVSRGWVKTGKVLYGMEVYDSQKNKQLKGETRDVFLFPPKNPQLFVSCSIPPGQTIDRILDFSLPGGCKVVSNIDDRVRAEYYYINYAQMLKLDKLNTELVTLLRSFMIK